MSPLKKEDIRKGMPGEAVPCDDPVSRYTHAIRELFKEPEFPSVAKLKEKGNPLYKTGKVEPIDLIRDGGMLWPFALSNIIKYAFRLRPKAGFKANEDRMEDLRKIIHYAEILIADAERGLNEANGIPGK